MDKQLAIASIIGYYKTDHITYGSMYILPDGTLLDLGSTGYGHSDLSAYLDELGIEIAYRPGTASKYLRSLNWVRLNTKLKFIDFPDKVFTSKQERKLTEAIDYMQDDIQVTVKGQSKVYKGVTTEYIIDRVKRCYSSGNLYEEKE